MVWDQTYENLCCSDDEPIKGASEYTEEQKLSMIEDELDNNDYFWEEIWELYHERRESWLDQVCLCRKKTAPDQKGVSFTQLNKVSYATKVMASFTYLPSLQLLKTHFGIEAVVHHEVMSENLVSLLPDISGYSEISYYTSCFLSISPPQSASKPNFRGRAAQHRNAAYLKNKNHLAFREIIKPTQLSISDQQKLRFAKAMRVLGLHPYYHLTELDALLSPDNDDKALWAFCGKWIKGRPKPTSQQWSGKVKLAQ